MMDKDKVSAFRLGIPLAAALLLLGVPTLSGATPTYDECDTAWNQSSASDSCRNEMLEVIDGKCSFFGPCKRTDGSDRTNSLLVDLEDFADLSNCNGQLKVGSCG